MWGQRLFAAAAVLSLAELSSGVRGASVLFVTDDVANTGDSWFWDQLQTWGHTRTTVTCDSVLLTVVNSVDATFVSGRCNNDVRNWGTSIRTATSGIGAWKNSILHDNNNANLYLSNGGGATNMNTGRVVRAEHPITAHLELGQALSLVNSGSANVQRMSGALGPDVASLATQDGTPGNVICAASEANAIVRNSAVSAGRRASLPFALGSPGLHDENVTEMARVAVEWVADHNDRPVVGVASLPTQQTPYTSAAVEFAIDALVAAAGVTDPDSALYPVFLGMCLTAVTGEVNGGVWQYATSAAGPWQAVGTVSGTNCLQLSAFGADARVRFAHAASPDNVGTKTLTMLAWDRTNSELALTSSGTRDDPSAFVDPTSPFSSMTTTLTVDIIAPPTTGVATTGVATTGVATTGVATTGVATTGVATTDIATTGTATTGTATTGVATTGAPASTTAPPATTTAPPPSATAAATAAAATATATTATTSFSSASPPAPSPSPPPPEQSGVDGEDDAGGAASSLFPFPWWVLAIAGGAVLCCLCLVVFLAVRLSRRKRRGDGGASADGSDLALTDLPGGPGAFVPVVLGPLAAGETGAAAGGGGANKAAASLHALLLVPPGDDVGDDADDSVEDGDSACFASLAESLATAGPDVIGDDAAVARALVVLHAAHELRVGPTPPGAAKDYGTTLDLVRRLMRIEAAEAKREDAGAAFRTNTIAIKAFVHFAKLVALDWLVDQIGPAFAAVQTAAARSADPPSLREGGGEEVLELAAGIVEAVCAAPLPGPLAAALTAVDGIAREALGDDEAAPLASSLLFLRFVSPLVVAPHLFGLSEEIPPRALARLLVDVSKVVQALATDSEIGRKDANLATLADAIQARRAPVRDYLDGEIARGGDGALSGELATVPTEALTHAAHAALESLAQVAAGVDSDSDALHRRMEDPRRLQEALDAYAAGASEPAADDDDDDDFEDDWSSSSAPSSG